MESTYYAIKGNKYYYVRNFITNKRVSKFCESKAKAEKLARKYNEAYKRGQTLPESNE